MRDPVALERGVGDQLAVDLLAGGKRLAEHGSRVRLRRQPALTAERGARGEGLDAAAVRAVALTGRSGLVDDHVPQLGAGASRAPEELAVDDDPAADPGADGQHQRVGGAAGRAKAVLGEHRDVGVVVEIGRRPSRSAIRSRIGTSTIGRLTELIAMARLRSIVLGTPRPIASTSGHASIPACSLVLSSSRSPSRSNPVVGRCSVKDRVIGVDDPDRHLCASQVGTDCLPHESRLTPMQEALRGMEY